MDDKEYHLNIRLEHLRKLLGSGYGISCSNCGYMYQKEPLNSCEHCPSKSFLSTREVIRRLELSL